VWDATPHNTALKPTLMRNAVHCRAAVSYAGGQGLSTVANTQLNPGGSAGTGGLAVFAVMRVLDVSSYAEAIIKSDLAMTQSWEISHGAAGGFSMNYLWRNGALANSFTTFTDTTNWHTWGMTIDVVDVTFGIKEVRGYRNDDRAGFSDGGLNAPTNQYAGAMNMNSKVYVGPMAGSNLRAHVFEYLIYNRAITPAERSDVFAYFDERYYLTCPVLASANAVNGDVPAGKAYCAPPAARWGRECYQTCNPGFVQTYGSECPMCRSSSLPPPLPSPPHRHAVLPLPRSHVARVLGGRVDGQPHRVRAGVPAAAPARPHGRVLQAAVERDEGRVGGRAGLGPVDGGPQAAPRGAGGLLERLHRGAAGSGRSH
jgi:hypothetical protein